MAAESKTKGKLISLDGAGSPEFTAAIERLLRHYRNGTIPAGASRFDASGIFFEMSRGVTPAPGPSARTLVLLYASDLIFRLRWEIRPALEEGQIVIAAPYVESAIAFGRAANLPRRWLVELFSFAPKAHAGWFTRDRKPSTEGFVNFCCNRLAADSVAWDANDILRKFWVCFDAVERAGRCKLLPKQLAAASR